MAAHAVGRIHATNATVTDEETVLLFNDEDIKDGIEKCSRRTIEAALYAIWSQPIGFKVIDHGGDLFQFFFDNETDLIRIERGAHWLFKNYILNLRRWNEDLEIKDEEFAMVPTWVQLWRLPKQCKTRNLGSKVGETLGSMLETDLFSIRGKEDRLLKAKVMLDITKPLRRSIKISGNNQKVVEVNLKYECIVRNCQQNLEDTAVG
ncbi:hypothetical protein Ahy_B06g084363 [Arachis hypogaea]|uniref:DUF4283 domain-containing protein n=1 Tax=Arachis hypogaea TaxID=3818 RepID=A0A444YRP4_ARAHY|nr:hypothetical protein Ahy_B06g084363 [Arachis hypogaea]